METASPPDPNFSSTFDNANLNVDHTIFKAISFTIFVDNLHGKESFNRLHINANKLKKQHDNSIMQLLLYLKHSNLLFMFFFFFNFIIHSKFQLQERSLNVIRFVFTAYSRMH